MESFKPTQSKLEEYLRHAAESMIRDAKNNIWEELPNLGEGTYMAYHMAKLHALMPTVSERIGDISYRILNARERRHTEVVFYIPVDGPLAPFATIGTHFRLRGEIGIEKPRHIYLYYREPYAATTQRLVEVLREDMELIHQYLEMGRAILDAIVTDATLQITQEINLMRAVLGDLPKVAEGLVELGFRSRVLESRVD